MENNDNMEILSQAVEEDHSQRLAELFEEPHFETFQAFYHSRPWHKWNDEAYDVFQMLLKLYPRITAECKMPSVIKEFPILNFTGWEWRPKDWCRIAFALGIPPDWFQDRETVVLAFNDYEWSHIRTQYSPSKAVAFWMDACKKADHILYSSSCNPNSFKQIYCKFIKHRMAPLQHQISVNHSEKESKWFACLHLALGQMVATFMKYIWFVDGGHSVSLINSVPLLVGHLNNLRCFGGGAIPAATMDILNKYIKEDFKKVPPRFWCKTGFATFLYSNGIGHGHRHHIEIIQRAQREFDQRFNPIEHDTFQESVRQIHERIYWKELFGKSIVFVHEMARKQAHQIAWDLAVEEKGEEFFRPQYQYLWDSIPNKPKQWSGISTPDLISAVDLHSQYIKTDEAARIGQDYISVILQPFLQCVYQRVILLPLNTDTIYFNLDYVDKIGVGSHETFPFNLASFRIRDDLQDWTFLSVPELREIKSYLGFSDLVLQVRDTKRYKELKQVFEKETNGDSNKPY